MPPLVRDLVVPDVQQRWERLIIGQQREVVSLLLDLGVGKTYRRGALARPRPARQLSLAWQL
ncbi:hypothetical protein E1193_00855 [Micromonospora sp. KC606]|uniref:hypothetical protein n=1 Tax=Micromonospora sp. KC606 TaxID=2530379 RepID=UPI0010524DC9|nr:hypothetical protein [Micromonospora sp. KC606]TDC86223.1 hypothetical protein E1193_00855 [Micromonospora sp. KC606]